MTRSPDIACPHCNSNRITKSGLNAYGQQRYRCQNPDCLAKTFMLKYRYEACHPSVKEKIVNMAINGGGIRSTARALGVNKNTVMNTLRKSRRPACTSPSLPS